MHLDDRKYPERFSRYAGATHGRVLASTRRVVEQQSPGAGFTTAPPVNTWNCGCGGVNPPRAISCRRCGRERA